MQKRFSKVLFQHQACSNLLRSQLIETLHCNDIDLVQVITFTNIQTLSFLFYQANQTVCISMDRKQQK